MAYLIGDSSGLGFVSVLWGQGMLSSESGGFCPFYQGRSSKFRELYNFITRIDQSVASVDLQDVKLFVFTENMVFESVYYKGTSKIPLLF